MSHDGQVEPAVIRMTKEEGKLFPFPEKLLTVSADEGVYYQEEVQKRRSNVLRQTYKNNPVSLDYIIDNCGIHPFNIGSIEGKEKENANNDDIGSPNKEKQNKNNEKSGTNKEIPARTDRKYGFEECLLSTSSMRLWGYPYRSTDTTSFSTSFSTSSTTSASSSSSSVSVSNKRILESDPGSAEYESQIKKSCNSNEEVTDNVMSIRNVNMKGDNNISEAGTSSFSSSSLSHTTTAAITTTDTVTLSVSVSTSDPNIISGVLKGTVSTLYDTLLIFSQQRTTGQQHSNTQTQAQGGTEAEAEINTAEVNSVDQDVSIINGIKGQTEKEREVEVVQMKEDGGGSGCQGPYSDYNKESTHYSSPHPHLLFPSFTAQIQNTRGGPCPIELYECRSTVSSSSGDFQKLWHAEHEEFKRTFLYLRIYVFNLFFWEVLLYSVVRYMCP